MKSLSNTVHRQAVLERLDSLSEDSRAQWGRLDVQRMLCHVGDALRMALGELPVKRGRGGVFQRFPLKHLLLYVAPMPKGVRTAPELLATVPGDLEADRARVKTLVERFASVPPKGQGPEHPFFGILSWPEWGVLQWRHLDHHLRQFGV